MVVYSAALAALVLAGCSSETPVEPAPAAPAATAAAPAVSTPAPCPTGGATTLTWPVSVPSELPTPPTARLTDVQDKADGLTVVTFTTSTSLREGVLFLVKDLPAAGFTLSRGDAENTEADVPFVKGSRRGIMRMIRVEPCRTDWLMAVTTAAPVTGNPLLPPRAGASPLPFG